MDGQLDHLECLLSKVYGLLTKTSNHELWVYVYLQDLAGQLVGR